MYWFGLAGLPERRTQGYLSAYIQKQVEKAGCEGMSTAEDKALVLAREFCSVMRIHGLEPNIDALDAALDRLKKMDAAAEEAVRAFARAGIESKE